MGLINILPAIVKISSMLLPVNSSVGATELPDMILLDLNMPVKDGYQTLKEIKRNDQLKKTPIIVLTSSSKAGNEQFCYQLGCTYFRQKPSTLHGYADLAHLISRYAGE